MLDVFATVLSRSQPDLESAFSYRRNVNDFQALVGRLRYLHWSAPGTQLIDAVDVCRCINQHHSLVVRQDLFVANENRALLASSLSSDERLVLCHTTAKPEHALDVWWRHARVL